MTVTLPPVPPQSPDLTVRPGWLREPLRRIAAWRARRRVSPGWTVAVALVLALVTLPIVSIVGLALAPRDNIWPHLMANVVPATLWTTLKLLAGVALLTTVIGTGTAWVVTMYRFPGRDTVSWLLLLPLAMPTYIGALCYAELLDFTGPVQAAVRGAAGWSSARDYWFPEVRSLGGAVLVISLVLYPYVYLTARASFLQQSACTLEVARTLGRTPWGVFWEVALPLARPALAAGVTLALMEALNDIGAVQHLGVRTLTVAIYDTWLQRSNLGGAAQIAAVMLVCVLLLLLAERGARGNASFHNMSSRYRPIPFAKLRGVTGRLAFLACLLPVLLGFGVPTAFLMGTAWRHLGVVVSGPFWSAAWHSLVLAALAAVLAVALGLLLAYSRRVAANGFTRPAVRLAGFGYAVPGTVVAIGLLIPLAAFDNWLDGLLRSALGVSSGLLLSGSIFAITLACVIRFLAVALGALEEGLGRVSPSLDAAARTLGETTLSTLARVHVPMLRPAVGAAALLVFVDCMKELPATLLLRPFNFDTLATHVYTFAVLEQFEEAGLAALTIVLIGLAPVLLLHRAIVGGRAGGAHGEE